jgi:hypothetical protein
MLLYCVPNELWGYNFPHFPTSIVPSQSLLDHSELITSPFFPSIFSLLSSSPCLLNVPDLIWLLDVPQSPSDPFNLVSCVSSPEFDCTCLQFGVASYMMWWVLDLVFELEKWLDDECLLDWVKMCWWFPLESGCWRSLGLGGWALL